MIIPKTKEELYIESLPFAERSAFSRARMNKGSLKGSGEKIEKIVTNSLKNRKPLSTTFVDDNRDIKRSSIGTDANPRFMSKRQRSCKKCGHEQSELSDNLTGSAQEIILNDKKSKTVRGESSAEKVPNANLQQNNTQSKELNKKPSGLVTVGDLDPQLDDYMEKQLMQNWAERHPIANQNLRSSGSRSASNRDNRSISGSRQNA